MGKGCGHECTSFKYDYNARNPGGVNVIQSVYSTANTEGFCDLTLDFPTAKDYNMVKS
jgi:hypothetical protein